MRKKTVKVEVKHDETSYEAQLGPRKSPFGGESNFNLLTHEHDKGVDKKLRKIKVRSRFKTVDKVAFKSYIPSTAKNGLWLINRKKEQAECRARGEIDDFEESGMYDSRFSEKNSKSKDKDDSSE